MATKTPNLPRQQPKKNDHDTAAQRQNGPHPETAPATGADYFEIVSRATNDAVRDWNVKTGALLWPRGLTSLLGHARGAASQKIGFWFEHIHPEDLPRIQDSLRLAFKENAETWKGEYRFRRSDGGYSNILERGLILRDNRGQAVRLVGTLMDVTTRRQLQAQARRSQRMEAFGQLAGGVAHDFNNFLTTILGYSDLLLHEKEVKGEIADQIKEIRDAAGRASSLTHQLLAFSRRQALEPTVLEVNSLISNLERTLLRLLSDNISVVCHLHHLKKGAYIKVDAGQFGQIILNLAVNARDAMRKGGRLTIETSALEVGPAPSRLPNGIDLPIGEYVTISLQDNGCGMSEAVKARLFEPFFTTKDDGHSGLGLATSYGIIRQSGGYICAESEPGKGSTFRIYLPRVAAPPPLPYKKPGHKKQLRGTETILVLEDEVSVRHISVRVLRNLGYEVLEAAHGEDAKRIITKRNGAPKIDLLLTDMVMPEISGRQFVDWLGQTSPETKVIFISGYLEESMHPGDRRDPGMCFLAKPFSADELASTVRELLDGTLAG